MASLYVFACNAVFPTIHSPADEHVGVRQAELRKVVLRAISDTRGQFRTSNRSMQDGNSIHRVQSYSDHRRK